MRSGSSDSLLLLTLFWVYRDARNELNEHLDTLRALNSRNPDFPSSSDEENEGHMNGDI